MCGYPTLYAASVTSLADPECYAAAYAAASSDRREKTDHYRFAKDKRLSLGAELLLRYALETEGVDGETMEFSYGAQKKPYLRDSDVFFSLSHSGDYVLCALASCEVGCDIEKIVPVALKLAKRFFFRGEYEDIAAQTTPEARNERFFRYWTLKESFMKATGQGMALPLDAFQIVYGEDISVIQSADQRQYRFAEFDGIPSYRCALCAAGDCRGTVLRMVDLRSALPSVQLPEKK